MSIPEFKQAVVYIEADDGRIIPYATGPSPQEQRRDYEKNKRAEILATLDGAEVAQLSELYRSALELVFDMVQDSNRDDATLREDLRTVLAGFDFAPEQVPKSK